MATETKSEQVRVVFVGNSAVAEKASPGNPEVHRPPGPMETSLPKDGDGLLLASLGFRAVAWVIDLLVVMLVAGMAGVARLRLVYALPLFFIAYHTSLVSLTGSTVGKALFGLKVNRSAKRINVAWALGRATLGYLVVDLFGLGLVAALFNAQRRCFHDFAFRSDVVFEGDDKLRAKILLSRLIDFAQRQQSAWD